MLGLPREEAWGGSVGSVGRTEARAEEGAGSTLLKSTVPSLSRSQLWCCHGKTGLFQLEIETDTSLEAGNPRSRNSLVVIQN